jgi:hypothetical protein
MVAVVTFDRPAMSASREDREEGSRSVWLSLELGGRFSEKKGKEVLTSSERRVNQDRDTVEHQNQVWTKEGRHVSRSSKRSAGGIRAYRSRSTTRLESSQSARHS